jgi:hypothetical protein
MVRQACSVCGNLWGGGDRLIVKCDQAGTVSGRRVKGQSRGDAQGRRGEGLARSERQSTRRHRCCMRRHEQVDGVHMILKIW